MKLQIFYFRCSTCGFEHASLSEYQCKLNARHHTINKHERAVNENEIKMIEIETGDYIE